MRNKFIDSMRLRLAGRSKRDLIEGMIIRSPHEVATNKTLVALGAYPLYLLMLAHDFPTKLWILDRGEKPSSAGIINEAVRSKRWHSARICIDDCEGVTEFIDNYVAVVVSWRTLLAMRHEFAHAITTFFSPTTRQRLDHLYRQAVSRDVFVEPLAAESIGEYAACGISYYFFPDLRKELQEVDPDLYELVADLLQQAEEISSLITSAEDTMPESVN